MSIPLVLAERLADAKLAARCPFCSLVHVWDAARSGPSEVLYFASLCNVRAAFDRVGVRRRLALRVAQS